MPVPRRGRRHSFRDAHFWEDTASIQRLAGDDYTRARYYDFDSDYLIELEPYVRHYGLYATTSPDPPLANRNSVNYCDVLSFTLN